MLFAISISANSQSPTYYIKKGNEVKSLDKADFYLVNDNDSTKDNRNIERKYNKLGQILSESRYFWLTDQVKQLDGISKEWYESGHLKKELNYKNGRKDGQLIEYSETGDTIRKVLFTNGNMGFEKLKDPEGASINATPDCMPQFAGGETALLKYITDHLKYPPSAQRAGLRGVVLVTFAVDIDGKVKNARVVKGFDYACEEEAIRVVIDLTFKPAMLNVKAKAIYNALPLDSNFSRTQQVMYQIVDSKTTD